MARTGSELTAAELLVVQTLNGGVLNLRETTAPSATAGFGKVYVKSSDSKLYFKDDSGTEYDLTASAGGANTALSNLAAVAINTSLLPGVSDGAALGSATNMWSDVFLASGAVINFNNGNFTATHSAGALAFSGSISASNLSGTNTGDQTYVAPRITSTASSTTPTPNADTTDVYILTALAAGATFGAPTGSPVQGQKLMIRVKDNGGAQTLAFNAIYRASSDLALPTTTTAGKTLYIGFVYNSTDTKWDLLAKLDNF